MINALRRKWGNQRHYYKHLHPERLDVTFVVSTGRTGTKYMEHLFQQVDPAIYAVHEPQPDLFDLGIQKYREGKSSEACAAYILKERTPMLRSLCAQRTMTYIESNPFASLLLPELLAAYPKAKFIMVTRDAQTYIRSALNKSPLDDGAFYFYDENDRRQRIRSLDVKGDPYASNWAQWSRRQKIAWYWNWCNHLLLDFAEAHPERCHLVAFEQLFSKEATTQKRAIRDVLDMVGYPLRKEQLERLMALSKNKKNATQAPIFSGVETWEADEQAEFQALTHSAQERIQQLIHSTMPKGA